LGCLHGSPRRQTIYVFRS